MKKEKIKVKSKDKKKDLEQHSDFFVGYQKLPNKDRRFLIAAVPLLVVAAGGLGNILGKNQNKPDAAIWGSRDIVIHGRLIKSPYPHLLVPNRYSAIGYDTVLLVQLGKHGAKKLVQDLYGEYITVKGKILSRHDIRYNYMMEIIAAEERRGIFPVPVEERPPQDMGTYRIRGQIVDSKCHFGVMRPSTGLTHKACAALCVRGGIPPIFIPQTTKLDRVIIARVDEELDNEFDDSSNNAVDNAIGQVNQYDYPDVAPFLPHMLDLIEAEGKLVLANNHYEFLINPASIDFVGAC